MAINFPLFYILILIFEPGLGMGSLRLTAALTSILLILFYKLWPQKDWVAWYWLFTVTLCLPFFFTYNLLASNLNTFSITSLWSAIFFVCLVLDTSAFYIVIFLGGFLGCLVYFLVFKNFNFNIDNLFSIISNLLASIVIIAIFSHNRARYDRERLRGARAITSMLAHELRTPLMAIGAGIQAFNKYLAELVRVYKIAHDEKLIPTSINPFKFKQIEKLIEDSEHQVNQAHNVISVISSGTELEFNISKSTVFSMANCLQTLINSYTSDEQKLIKLEVDSDFKLNTDAILLSHVFENLFRNAFYAIRQANKGNIRLFVTKEEQDGVVIFEDTALGISKPAQKRIFKPFYTNKDNRTSSGLGLYYCKQALEKIGASITVTSEEGKFTRFELHFKLKES